MQPIIKQPIPGGSFFKSRSSTLALSASLFGLVLMAWPLSAQAQYRWGPDPRDMYEGPYGPYGYGEPGPYYGPYEYRHRGYGYAPEEADLGPDREAAPSEVLHPRSPRTTQPRGTITESKRTTPLPTEAIQKQVRSAGYRLIATPRHDGKIYLAEVEDKDAVRHRLVYDAFDGHLVENTVLGSVKKPISGKTRASSQD